jgi:hypothetical protein
VAAASLPSRPERDRGGERAPLVGGSLTVRSMPRGTGVRSNGTSSQGAAVCARRVTDVLVALGKVREGASREVAGRNDLPDAAADADDGLIRQRPITGRTVRHVSEPSRHGPCSTARTRVFGAPLEGQGGALRERAVAAPAVKPSCSQLRRTRILVDRGCRSSVSPPGLGHDAAGPVRSPVAGIVRIRCSRSLQFPNSFSAEVALWLPFASRALPVMTLAGPALKG